MKTQKIISTYLYTLLIFAAGCVGEVNLKNNGDIGNKDTDITNCISGSKDCTCKESDICDEGLLCVDAICLTLDDPDNPNPSSCTGDGNNSVDCANKLSANVEINGQIGDENDEDWYKFEVPYPGIYTILIYDEAENLCSVDTVLSLYDSDKTTLFSLNNDSSEISGPVPDPCSAIRGKINEAGTYFLKLRTYQAGSGPKSGMYTIKYEEIYEIYALTSGIGHSCYLQYAPCVRVVVASN